MYVHWCQLQCHLLTNLVLLGTLMGLYVPHIVLNFEVNILNSF